jgi:hypothetical protein
MWLSHVSAGSRASQDLTEYFSPRWMDQSRSIVFAKDQELPKQKARMIFEYFSTSLCGVLVFCWLSAFSSSSRHPASSSLRMTLVYQLVSIITLLFKRLNPQPIKKVGALYTPSKYTFPGLGNTLYGEFISCKKNCLSQRGGYLHSASLCPPYCLCILGAI